MFVSFLSQSIVLYVTVLSLAHDKLLCQYNFLPPTSESTGHNTDILFTHCVLLVCLKKKQAKVLKPIA